MVNDVQFAALRSSGQFAIIRPMKTPSISVQSVLVLLLGLALGFSSILLARENHYFVYCANGKIEVDSRDLEHMKSARGSDVHQLGAFHYLGDAQDYAKRFGGVGADCSGKR